MSERRVARSVDWITLTMIIGTYVAWAGVLFWLADFSLILAIPCAALLITFHSSLTHEVLHGHPFTSRVWNEALMRWPLDLCVPYARFRDLHLAHHRDANLTDPYDDPETNYLDPEVWSGLPRAKQVLYSFNNTLGGRILVGPVIGQTSFMLSDWRQIRRGNRQVLRAWVQHAIGAAVVIAVVLSSAMPFWAYLAANYLGMGVLRIRSFLEHQAHDKVRGRTVIIEDHGPLAWLFLYNNLHVVHHMHPAMPWYRLPALYRRGRARFQAINEGYVYRSYAQVFRAYLLRTKDPVAHPLWRKP